MGSNWTPDKDSLFVLTKMKQTVCIYFKCLTSHYLLDISYEWESEKCHSSTLEQLFCHISKKWNGHLSQMSKIFQYPITSLIFVIESQTLCLYPCLSGSRKPVFTFNLWLKKHLNFLISGCIAIICWGPIGPPTHIWLHGCHSSVELENIIWNEITIDSLTKS